MRIFPGDLLSPLLFISYNSPHSAVSNSRRGSTGFQITTEREGYHLPHIDDAKLYGKTRDDLEVLMNTVRIFTDDIKMKFGVSKRTTIVIKRGKNVEDGGIQMPNRNSCRRPG